MDSDLRKTPRRPSSESKQSSPALIAGGAKKGNMVFDILSRREVEVLQLLCEGKSVKEIAEILGLSPKTVDSHRANIMGKLDVRDVPSLVKFAIRPGVTEPLTRSGSPETSE